MNNKQQVEVWIQTCFLFVTNPNEIINEEKYKYKIIIPNFDSVSWRSNVIA